MADAGPTISYEQMRSLVIEHLKTSDTGQLEELRTSIRDLAVRHGQANAPGADCGFGRNNALISSDFARVVSIVWDLIIEGVIRPGRNDGQHNDLPFFHVTEYGKTVLEKGRESPYDPDGYLARLNRDVPNLDPVIETYLNESLRTLRIGCLLSSTIALGCASEKALLVLIAAYADSLPAKERSQFLQKVEGRMIKRQFDEFRKRVDGQLRSQLPDHLEDGLDIELTALFEFIRTQRNDAGHPTGKGIERERAYANLVVFPTYLKKVYSLIDWLNQNPYEGAGV